METAADNSRVVPAYVPMLELANYTNDLSSITRGQAKFEMAFSHYQDSGSDDGGDAAGVPSPLKPVTPTLSAGAAAEPPVDPEPSRDDIVSGFRAMSEDEAEEDQHERALRLVREQYEGLVAISRASNEAVRGQKMRFLAEQLARANAVNTFAVNAKLIHPAESLRIMKECFDANPELMELFREGEPREQQP